MSPEASPEGLHNEAPYPHLKGRNTEAVNGTQANTAPDTAADPPPNISQRMHEHDYSQPYIKKPSNAFMIFRKEQSPVVAAELQHGDSASVNTILGQRWKALSQDQQAKYYNLAEMERTLHSQLHPEWSSSENYGKNRKRGKQGKRNVPN
ncbi:transcription factor 7-like 1-A [Pleuronectes platessa]|uniref:transcription factor 7-like 1-A n=1 Tax=Pleuronectes platessa TaxID=8262 RepID=UPI00232A560E|nr:transcription factor 7-like 1-A [Pleuronectes platessa]